MQQPQWFNSTVAVCVSGLSHSGNQDSEPAFRQVQPNSLEDNWRSKYRSLLHVPSLAKPGETVCVGAITPLVWDTALAGGDPQVIGYGASNKYRRGIRHGLR